MLMLTTVYPRLDGDKATDATKVIHYFTKEWIKNGHEVVVIHVSNQLPKGIYYLPQNVKEKIKSKTGFEVPDPSILNEKKYIYDNVPVYRIVIPKMVPRGLHSRRNIDKAAEKIWKRLQELSFYPDVITGHWASPNAQLLVALKKYYQCKTALVFHGTHYAAKYTKVMRECAEEIDVIGCRSETMAQEIQKILNLPKKPFICYSGVPDQYIGKIKVENVTDKHSNATTQFIYVGQLIKRKNVDTIIYALSQIHRDYPWHLDVVGSGAEMSTLKSLCMGLGIQDRVTFHGRISRDDVFGLMMQSQVFTMISRGEAFGLVYLEAMATGGITIGARNEGIDGIIVDGKNGFLCDAGNVEQLVSIYKKIIQMEAVQKKKLAACAYKTACQMSDSAVARDYINHIK